MSAIVSVTAFQGLLNRLVRYRQIPWLSALELLCPLIKQLAVLRLCGLSLLGRCRDIALGGSDEAVNLIKQQPHAPFYPGI